MENIDKQDKSNKNAEKQLVSEKIKKFIKPVQIKSKKNFVYFNQIKKF
jgi:hypothetical protein